MRVAVNVNGKLFVYGALLDSDERVRLLGRVIQVRPARLAGYERGRRRYFFVVPRDGSFVEGELLLDLGPADFSVLDEYEEVPRLYTRKRVEVTGPERKIHRCWIYLPTGWERG